MAQHDQLLRFIAIIRRLEKSPATFSEVNSYVQRDAEIRGYKPDLSPRNFSRHISDIRSVFGIDISYNRTEKAYLIVGSADDALTTRLTEALETINVFNLSSAFSKFLFFEKRRATGIEHLLPLLKAIKQRKVVELEYQRFWDEYSFTRKAEPYALREFESRWYLIAKDTEDGCIKSYGLDRLHSFTATQEKFPDNSFNADEYFGNCYGIIRPHNQSPKTIRLSFTAEQGKYVKTLPMHHTQKILTDNTEELVTEITVYPTVDLIMKILSFGEEVEVLKPAKLRKEIHRIASAVAAVNS